MSDILVSIIESVAEAAANARARRGEAPAPRVAFAPPQAPAPAPAPAVVVRKSHKPKPAAPTPADPFAPSGERRIEPKLLFADPQSLIRTVVATEILGPPLALRRQNLWEA